MPLMTIFEPFFLLGVFVVVVVLLSAAFAALSGRRAQAVSRLKRLGIGSAAYMVAVLVVAAATPRKWYRVGDAQCFDDWCITVTSATRTADNTVAVNLRLSSRAKRISQSEKGMIVYVIDAAGRRYDPEADPAGVPLDTRLAPGQSVDAPRRFAVQPDARALGLVYTHHGGFPIGFFIIGENEAIHGPPVVRLDTQAPR